MEDDPKVIQLQRNQSPAQKLNTAAKMYLAAREWKLAALRSFHPDWPEQKIQQEFRNAFHATRS
jgi:hypothetical protein